MTAGLRCLLAAAAAACAASCVRPVHSVAADVDPRCWAAGEEALMEYDNDDTLSLRDIYLILRINDNMTRPAVRLRISTLAPDSTQTHEEVLFDFAGVKRFNSPVEAERLYRRAARLSQAGRYRFSAMPVDTLRGVMAAIVEMRNFTETRDDG